MEEKKQEETTPVSTDTTSTEPTTEETTTDTTVENEVTQTPVENEAPAQTETGIEAEAEAETKAPFKGMKYIIAVIVVIIIALGLVFLMEKEDRLATGIFTGVIENMEANLPSAKVNGVVISKSDFDSGVNQLIEVAKVQGADMTNPQIMEQFNTQAIETLINGELLRQAAEAKEVSASTEEVDSRLDEITEGVGGAEALQARLVEFGITEENLRRDVENEILIQGLFEIVIEKDESEVTEEEVLALYEQAGGEEGGLPPLEDVRGQIEEQIILGREQQQIGVYIDALRGDADVEILI
jgi:peptidyl-prolyl cis-trans isomerase SurA